MEVALPEELENETDTARFNVTNCADSGNTAIAVFHVSIDRAGGEAQALTYRKSIIGFSGVCRIAF